MWDGFRKRNALTDDIEANTAGIAANAGYVISTAEDVSDNADAIAATGVTIEEEARRALENTLTFHQSNRYVLTKKEVEAVLTGFINSHSHTSVSHASNHVNGTDDIQSATLEQKGLATAEQVTDISSNKKKRSFTKKNEALMYAMNASNCAHINKTNQTISNLYGGL